MTDDKAVQVTFCPADYELIENWRRAQPRIPALATLVRAFTLQGIKDDKRHPKTAA